jgi:uncharacterized protein DUF3551
MRALTAVVLAMVASSFVDDARADPYRWCAEFGSQHSGATSCYSVTLEQCRATVSGVGGFCRENPFYDGLPVRTPEDGLAPRRRPRSPR